MKREIRSMKVKLCKKIGIVEHARCNCPAGESGFCNHVMTILFQLADFSLHQVKDIPEEIACTSTSRQWGVPSDACKFPKPVMEISVQKNVQKRGVSCTLYNPRINSDKSFVEVLQKHTLTWFKKIKELVMVM